MDIGNNGVNDLAKGIAEEIDRFLDAGFNSRHFFSLDT